MSKRISTEENVMGVIVSYGLKSPIPSFKTTHVSDSDINANTLARFLNIIKFFARNESVLRNEDVLHKF